MRKFARIPFALLTVAAFVVASADAKTSTGVSHPSAKADCALTFVDAGSSSTLAAGGTKARGPESSARRARMSSAGDVRPFRERFNSGLCCFFGTACCF